MSVESITTIIPIVAMLFYIAPIVLVIWFIFKFIKLQQERNHILRNISEKLDKLNNTNS